MTTDKITYHINASFPILFVETADEQQVLREAESLESIQEGEKRLATYSATGKLRFADQGDSYTEPDYLGAIDEALKQAEGKETPGVVLIMFDAQHFIESADFYRHLIESMPHLKQETCTLVLVAPDWTAKPKELLHNAPVLSIGLPTREQLKPPAIKIAADNGLMEPTEEELAALADAAAGLTVEEAENAYALSLALEGEIVPHVVQSEKMRLIRGTGYLEVSQPVDPDQIGGLSELKKWLSEMVEERDDDQLSLRGYLACGLAGNGKSLIAKATGAMFGLPVVSLSLSNCRGGIVGESEKNLRNAFRLAEAVAPCVLWLDELDKAVGGHKSSAETDGGTGLGMLGQLLTWLQEHRSPIITVATCNEFHAIPETLTRPGRMDERFFVDLPTEEERRHIADIHLTRFRCAFCDADLQQIAQLTKDWTGAEIEEACKRTARISKRKPCTETIAAAVATIQPMSRTNAAEVQRQRESYGRILRRANSPETKTEGARKVALAK